MAEKTRIEELTHEQQLAEAKELLRLQEEYKQAGKELNKVDAERLRLLEAGSEKLQQSTDFVRTQLGLQEKYVKKLKERIDLQEEGYAQDQMHMALRRQAAEFEKQKLAAYQRLIEMGETLTDKERDAYEDLKKRSKIINANAAAYAKIETDKHAAVGLEAKLLEQTSYWAAAVDQGAAGQLLHNKLLAKGDALLSKLWGQAKDLVFEYDKLTKEFEKQFQLNEEYTDSIRTSYKELNEYGVSLEEATKAQGALVKGVTDYTLMAKGQRDMLLENAAVATQLGVGIDDYAKGIQNSMKIFGQSAAEAVTTQSKLAATARALGRDQGEFAAAYAQSASALAKFGDQGVKAFGDLQRIAKITGMEMEKVLQLTNKFDTFEDAATMTGKLNAALGGNFVNAMDMMMETDPAARFGNIRDAILDSGLSFDTMSYYQKQFYTESLGLGDVGDLALMLSGNMDMLTDSTNQSAESLIEQKKRAKDVMTMEEAWNAILAENVEFFVDIAELLQALVRGLSTYATELKVLLPLYVAYRALTMSIVIAQGLQIIANAAVGKSGKKAAASVWLMVVALGLLGAAMLIESPSKLVLYMFALAAGLLAVGVAGKFASPGLTALGASLATIAAPVAVMSLSIAAVAVGIGLMAAGFSLMFEAIDLEKMVALGLLMWAGASIGVAGSIGMAAFGLSLGGVALGLGLINEEKLKAISQFATAMASLETKKMETLASSIERVADAMDRIPAMKAIAIASTIKAAATLETATTGATAGGAAAAAGADKYNITINVEMDGDVVGRKAVTALEGVVEAGILNT